jgi:Zn-dependent M28 family amino/carboxypeptidase
MRRRVGITTCTLAVLLALAWVNTAAQQPTRNFGNSNAIGQDELKAYEYFLASDEMEGRSVPSRGYDASALYVASLLREWGLKPGGSSSGTIGPLQPYLMPIELVSTQNDTAGMKLSLTAPAPAGRGGRGGAGAGGDAPAAQPPVTRTFEYAREWTLGGGGGFGGGRGGSAPEPADIVNAGLVFVGDGYVINKTNVNPYQGIDVRGKVVVVAGMPPELATAARTAASGQGGAGAAGGRGGRGGPNPLGVENTDFVTPQTYAARNGAVAVVMVPTFQQLAAMANPPAGRAAGPNGPPYQVVKFQAARAASVPVITAGVALTNALFQGEKLTGAQVFDGAAAGTKLDSFVLSPEKKLSAKISVTSDKGHTENVIGMLEGSDPVLRGEYVVISAHLDHIGLRAGDGDVIYNGADDDASGSAAVLAVAHAFAQGAARGMRPKRSIIFLWMAGEERGLWGSQYFNQFPPVDGTKIVADLNMDMIGRTKPKDYVDPPTYKLVAPGEVFVVGPEISSADLDKTLEAVNGSYQKLKLDHFYDVTAPDATHDNLGPQPNGQRIFYRSDHYNFARMGIPIAFFTTGLHPDYHQVTDSPDKLDYLEMEKVTKTVSALAWVLATQSGRPKLNTKLPDRLVEDMKIAKEQGWGKLTPVLPPLPGMPF